MHNNIQTEGSLFEAIQTHHVFSDGKTFVDCTPNKNPALILEDFLAHKEQAHFSLAAFVKEHFTLPEPTTVSVDPSVHMENRIENLWHKLSQIPDQVESPYSTLLHLPHPYIVPGGRFREIYYWDTYFTSEGLAVSGHLDMVFNMAKNFAYLIETVGHIPNGSRTYYRSRSQPPYFCCMLDILERHQGRAAILEFIPALEKEYQFWMDGADELTPNSAYRRVVKLEDGSVLNRFWDDDNSPRAESYAEDLLLYQTASKKAQPSLYVNIRAACESGWDFSSRWCDRDADLTSTCTTEIIPIDLNALLYHIEKRLAELFATSHPAKANYYQQAAKQRQQAIQQFCWNATQQFYFDYRWTQQRQTKTMSLAATMPLFVKLCDQQQAAAITKHLTTSFLVAGGLVTTLTESAEQWDKPNGWAPLHWITIQGLLNYGEQDLAKTIAKRWITLNRDVFKRSGKMMEKYNVIDTTLFAGGGEYPLQDGFGWTNGIAIALIKMFAL